MTYTVNALILDALILILFVGMILLGRRRGFIKTVSGVVVFVAALMLSATLSGPVSNFLYGTFVEPPVLEELTAHVGEGSPAAGQLDAALERMPAFVTNRLSATGVDSGAAVLERLSGAQTGETVADTIARQVVEPVVLPLMKSVATLLLFLLLLIGLSIVVKAVDLVAKLPLLKQLNKSLGVVAGIAQGLLWSFVLVTVLQLVANAGWLDFLTPAVLDKTLLLRWINSINPMTAALREMITF